MTTLTIMAAIFVVSILAFWALEYRNSKFYWGPSDITARVFIVSLVFLEARLIEWVF